MASVAAAVNSSPFAWPARSATHVRIAGLAVLCALTLVAPALLLVWMPLVLGVPHIASDLRYLVLPLPRWQVITAVVAIALLVGLKAASIATGTSLIQAEMVVVACWLIAAMRGRQLALGLALCASAVIIALPIQFAVFAAFAHNFVALVAWVVVAKPGRKQVAALVTTVIAAVGIVALAGPSLAARTGGDLTPWLTIDRASAVMFGGVPLATARSLMIAFAFLQGLHYAIWLAWIPSSQPARWSRRALAGIGIATLGVIGAAAVDTAWARTTYLALASFHIYLELVVLSARLAHGRRA